ncbi:MAG: YbaB/EbfC family nucleoid-associated protein [Bdellovibrionota bacterium]|nr:MAG: YbaB/EbfC family nucleoid-associated protein [Bdellovibrionota bacterium]
MAKGFQGIPGNLQQMMKQAQKMQSELQRIQDQADALTAEGSAGGGVVQVVANGKNQLVSVTIKAEVMSAGDVEMLQDLIVAASNEALTRVQAELKESVSKVTGGLPIPGL